jgi:hypothetical protein
MPSSVLSSDGLGLAEVASSRRGTPPTCYEDDVARNSAKVIRGIPVRKTCVITWLGKVDLLNNPTPPQGCISLAQFQNPGVSIGFYIQKIPCLWLLR